MTIKTTMIAALAGVMLLLNGAAMAAGQGPMNNQMGAGQGMQMTVPDASTCNCKDGTCPMQQGDACNCKDGTCPMKDGGACNCKDGTCPMHGGQGSAHHGGMHGGKGGQGDTCPMHGGQGGQGGMHKGGHGGHGAHGGGAMSGPAFTLDDARSVLDQKIQLKKDANLKIGTVTQIDPAFIRGTIVDANGKVVADYIFAVATGDWTKIN